MVFFTNQYIKFLIWYNQSNINHFLLAIYFTSYDIHMLPHVNVDLCGKKVGTYLPTYLPTYNYGSTMYMYTIYITKYIKLI
jgi:hypothetical protein